MSGYKIESDLVLPIIVPLWSCLLVICACIIIKAQLFTSSRSHSKTSVPQDTQQLEAALVPCPVKSAADTRGQACSKSWVPDVSRGNGEFNNTSVQCKNVFSWSYIQSKKFRGEHPHTHFHPILYGELSLMM